MYPKLCPVGMVTIGLFHNSFRVPSLKIYLNYEYKEKKDNYTRPHTDRALPREGTAGTKN